MRGLAPYLTAIYALYVLKEIALAYLNSGI